jgi:hypothetical protein
MLKLCSISLYDAKFYIFVEKINIRVSEKCIIFAPKFRKIEKSYD